MRAAERGLYRSLDLSITAGRAHNDIALIFRGLLRMVLGGSGLIVAVAQLNGAWGGWLSQATRTREPWRVKRVRYAGLYSIRTQN